MMTSVLLISSADAPEDSDPYLLAIHLKTGAVIEVCNQYGVLLEVVDQLMSDSEFDNGDGTVTIDGVKMADNQPIPIVVSLKPWTVAAVELSPISIEVTKALIESAKIKGSS